MKDNELSEFLIGGWQLLAWTIDYPDGKTTWPFGEGASGQILYSADGYMSATIMAAERAQLSHNNVRATSHEEQAIAFQSYFHYAGRWSVEGNQVIHRVDLALNPNFVGSVQRRDASSQNPRQLILSATEKVDADMTRSHKLEWYRN